MYAVVADITEANNQTDSAGLTAQEDIHLLWGNEEGHNSKDESQHPHLQDTNCDENGLL
jgi:hypothetical protein